MNKNSGLTLIELIVVMGLIGILASAVITLINPLSQIAKANDAKRKSDLAQIQRALELYYNDYKTYPADATVAFGSAWLPYMAGIPQDPKGGHNYEYRFIDANTYCLATSLEYAEDPQLCGANLTTPCTNATGNCGAGLVCNYGACSSNIAP